LRLRFRAALAATAFSPGQRRHDRGDRGLPHAHDAEANVAVAVGGSAPIAVSGTTKLADRFERGELVGDPKFRAIWKEVGQELAPLWRRLGDLCGRLEALAHKQLRGVPFSTEEKQFLIHYGESLAGIMLYGSNSYLTPRDDAPRIVDVFYNPKEKRVLEVGIARARALYVVYPVKGGEILCRGSVMPYYEFTHRQRLTDAEWKNLLDSKDRPDLPSWIKTLAGRDGITVPKFT